MLKMLIKSIKLVASICILFWMASIYPPLGSSITINGFLGIFLGVVYVKDSTGRYHYGWSGQFVSRDEAFCLRYLLPILGIGIPVITIFSLPMIAMEQLFYATFGAEFIGFIGGMFST
ncbi:MAG: hypothetical protein ACFFE2_16005 [Candidatus Thorarchaeota archaeon]